MGWSIGFDANWNRDIGYGVPAVCDHPQCSTRINRGLAYVCGGEPYGGEKGCGLYFCLSHLKCSEVDDEAVQVCDRCAKGERSFASKQDAQDWIDHKLSDPSWEEWRLVNPLEVEKLKNGAA